MYKFISNLCFALALGLLVVTLAKPDTANRIVGRIFGPIDTTADRAPVATTTSPKKDTELAPSTVLSYLKTIQPVSSTKNAEVVDDLPDSGIIDATNRERVKAGMTPLKWNAALMASANAKTNDMIARQYFEHTSPNGDGVAELGIKAGYDYVIIGENLAYGDFIDSDDLLNAWMESPGHRANILNEKYQEIGVAAIKAVYQGREVWFAVQHFGTNRTACPVIDAALKRTIDTIDRELLQRRAQIANERALLEGPSRPQGEEYKARVDEFNKLVAQYNTALVVSREKSKQYNAQITAFNACLYHYQAK